MVSRSLEEMKPQWQNCCVEEKTYTFFLISCNTVKHLQQVWLTSHLSKNPHIMDGRWVRNTYLGGSGFSIRLLAPRLLFLLPFQKSSMMFFFSTRGQEPQQNVVLWGQEMYWFILDLAEYLVSCPWQIFIDWIEEPTIICDTSTLNPKS